jgi:hypothetical protein
MKINIPSHLSDDDLVAKVTSLAGREREATVDLIAHLAELDARRLYLGAGFSSLFTYCTEILQLSEAEAYNRIEAARAARRFPVILDRLAEGSLNLTTVRLLASHLTDENHLDLLAAASGKSRRAVEELRARYFPQADVASSVRKLPAPRPVPEQTIGGSRPSPSTTSVVAPVTAPAPVSRHPVVTALAPDRYQIRVTATAETCEKLRLAQDMLRHAIPTGDPGEIIDRALTALLEELARKKFAKTDRPRASRGVAPGSRYNAAKVRRSVWIREGGRCAYVSKGVAAATNGPLSSSITWIPMGWEARRPWKRWSFAVAPTTTTRPSSSTAVHSQLVLERVAHRRPSRPLVSPLWSCLLLHALPQTEDERTETVRTLRRTRPPVRSRIRSMI